MLEHTYFNIYNLSKQIKHIQNILNLQVKLYISKWIQNTNQNKNPTNKGLKNNCKSLKGGQVTLEL